MLRRPTAVKLLPSGQAGADRLQRFEREVQMTSRLTHPNTVAIFDYGRTPDGVFYYAMEYLEGFTLTELVQTAGPLPPSRIAFVLRQIAGSLAEAHAVGLIHRDVKPDNVIVCDRGGLCDLAKVLDFGLVKEFQSPETAVSTADAVIGTPLYMSPEAFRAPGSVGVASDLYCLGAVAYYLATGRHVFEASSFVEISSHHLMTPPEPPSKRRGSPLPEKLERLILACLEKDPADRPKSATAVELAAIEITDAEPWTQSQARGWWDHNRAVLAHLRSSRVGGASGPNRPRILRSLASPEDALAPTVSATRRPA
jgi:serine/threonine-protein kinase